MLDFTAKNVTLPIDSGCDQIGKAIWRMEIFFIEHYLLLNENIKKRGREWAVEKMQHSNAKWSEVC